MTGHYLIVTVGSAVIFLVDKLARARPIWVVDTLRYIILLDAPLLKKKKSTPVSSMYSISMKRILYLLSQDTSCHLKNISKL